MASLEGPVTSEPRVFAKLHIQDGQLVDTITNDFGGSPMVPRVASIMKIVRIDEHELVLSDTNSSTRVSYRNPIHDAEPAGCTERRDRASVDNRTSLARRR